jgi:hypothetical protein
MCTDGYGFLDIPLPGVVDVRTFQSGLYRCGKEITSTNVGQTCKTYHDCPSSVTGVFAQCGCTYSDTGKRCDLLHSNTEYQDYI